MFFYCRMVSPLWGVGGGEEYISEYLPPRWGDGGGVFTAVWIKPPTGVWGEKTMFDRFSFAAVWLMLPLGGGGGLKNVRPLLIFGVYVKQLYFGRKQFDCVLKMITVADGNTATGGI